MMAEKLKPCPFCGGEVTMIYNSFDNSFNFYHKSEFDAIECCVLEPIVLDGLPSLAEARKAWNRRVGDSDENGES